MNWRQIRANILMVGGSQLGQKLVGFLVIAIMTRHLARERMGEFFLAAAIGTITAQATELGTTRHLIRSVARDRGKALDHLSGVISLRLPVMVLAFLLVNAACLVVRPALSGTLLLVSFYLLLQDLVFSFSAFFVGLELYGYRVTIELVGQVVLAGLVLLVVSQGGGLQALLWAYVVTHATVVAVTYGIVRAKHGPIHLRWDLEGSKDVLRQALPVFGITILDAVHFKAGTVMLGFLQPLAAVASYEAAYRLFEVSRLGIRPVALIFYPICVALAARHDWPALRRLFRKLTATSLLIGAAAALFVVIAAGLVVPLVFGGKYLDSVPLARVLFLAAPTLFTGVLTVFLIHTLHLELIALRVVITCIVANVVLNAVAIPLWGPMGAACVTLVTQTLWSVWIVRIVLRRLREARVPSVDLATPEEESFAV
jgi:O-antigen/teichoic acid export membrane protein